MSEAEQLAILERVPGFSRPSAAWLAGLGVGDRVMLYIMKDNGFVEWGPSIVEDKYLHSFELRYLDALYPVNRSGNLTEGGGQDRIWTYWIGPIEPEPPRQGAPAEEDDEDDWLTGAVKAATKFKSDLHQIAAQLGIPTDEQVTNPALKRRGLN